MTVTAMSINNVRIRLPDEKWHHIVQRHDDLAEQRGMIVQTIAAPTRILQGNEGAFMAIREIKSGKWLVVVYREAGADGFVVTAFTTRKINSLNRRPQLWP